MGPNDSQGLDLILLCYRMFEQNAVWEDNYSNSALNRDLVRARETSMLPKFGVLCLNCMDGRGERKWIQSAKFEKYWW